MISDFSHYLVLTMLLEGRTPGKIWVNHPETPTTALVWDQLNALFFLLGNASDNRLNQELNSLIMDAIFPDAIQLEYRKFFLQFTPQHTWEAQIGVILKGAIIEQQSIYSYTFDPQHSHLTLNWEPRLPAGYKISRLTAELLNNTDIKDLDPIVSGIRAC